MVGTIAEKAKGPAFAGGAALVGLAGGLALRGNKRRGVMGRVPSPKLKAPSLKPPAIKMPKKVSRMQMPKPDSALKAVGHAAGEVAQRSQRLGQVASEVQKASDAIADSKRG